MNGKNSHCMSKRILFLIAWLLSFAASAQTYDKAYLGNPWNDGKGATGLRLNRLEGAFAETYGSFVKGNLRSSSEAASAWTAGIKTAAVRHFGRFSAAGSFGYEQFWGRNMAGSMLIRPAYYPVDVYEFTPGPKVRQTYLMSGALCADISESWRIGTRLAFTSANLAKLKDLRHTTYLMDFSVLPGIQYHRDRFAVALNYLYARSVETIRAEQVGTKVASYEAFLDKGLFYGVGQLWTGSGVHLDETGVDGFPLREQMHGVSLQLSQGNFYAGVLARLRSGQAGEKQRVWYRFRGWDLDADAEYRFKTAGGSHSLHASFDFLSQGNNEYALEQKTEGGVTTTVTLGSNRVFGRSTAKAALRYAFTGRVMGFSLTGSFLDREGAASVMYPYLSTQRVWIPSVDARVSALAGPVAFRLDLGWACGKLSEQDTQVPHTVEPVSVPQRLERYFVRYREHMTCQKIVVAPGLRWRFARLATT